jgi:hypothetical protein
VESAELWKAKRGRDTTEGQKGCFAISSMRELDILPPASMDMLGHSRNQLKQLFVKNIEAQAPKAAAHDLASMS